MVWLVLGRVWVSNHVLQGILAVEDEAAKKHPTYSPHPRGGTCLPTLLEDLSFDGTQSSSSS